MSAFDLHPSTELAHCSEALPLELEDELRGLRVGYQSFGSPAAPAVLALGGISAGAHLCASEVDSRRGWWEALVGPSRALDPAEHRLLGVDWVGGSGASSGPRDEEFLPGRAWPRLTPVDQARVLLRWLDAVGVERLHAVVGYSYGGMVALQLARLAPERVGRVVAMGAADRSQPWSRALRSLQRRALREACQRGDAQAGVAYARALGMLSYRSAEEFEHRFAQERAQDACPAEEYLEARGAAFAEHFDARALHLLSLSIDLQDLDPAEVSVPTTLLASETDLLVPSAQMHALSERLPDCRTFEVLRSPFGHDAFLKEGGSVGRVVRAALEDAR